MAAFPALLETTCTLLLSRPRSSFELDHSIRCYNRFHELSDAVATANEPLQRPEIKRAVVFVLWCFGGVDVV